MLNDGKVCDLFYSEYRAEHSETAGIYVRYQFAVAAIALIAGVVVAITTSKFLSLCWTRIDVFAYYAFTALVCACLLSSSVCLVISIKPRKFQHLDNLGKWNTWRSEYRSEVIESGFADGDRTVVEETVAIATCNEITNRLAEATDWNALQNRIKLKWFNYYFYLTVAAIGFVLLQALMHSILFLNGIKIPQTAIN